MLTAGCRSHPSSSSGGIDSLDDIKKKPGNILSNSHLDEHLCESAGCVGDGDGSKSRNLVSPHECEIENWLCGLQECSRKNWVWGSGVGVHDWPVGL